MTTWILIAYFGYRMTGFTAEFSTLQRCEAAKAELLKSPYLSNDARIFCTEK